jgi:hypothetical protein
MSERRPILSARCMACLSATGLAALLAGCTTLPHPAAPAELTPPLLRLAATVDAEEADALATTACDYSWQLAQTYRVVRPARFHNLLVNCGLRERGLCYHWADDLGARLDALKLRTLELHRVVAHPGRLLREHNALVVTAVGQPFEQGVVLDAWRDSGRLFWCAVQADKYPWTDRDTEAGAEAKLQSAATPTR